MDKRYKIGIFIDTYFPMVDGVTVGVNSIVKILNKSADVTVFTAAPKDGVYDDSALEYRVVRCKSAKIPFVKIDYAMPVPKLDKRFKKELEASELDLVHIRSPFGVGKAGIRYAKRHGIPAVMTLHSQYRQDFYKNTRSRLLTAFLMSGVRRVFKKCGECWSVNEASKEILYDYGAKAEPVVMENGTDMLPVADAQGAKDRINALCGIDSSKKVLLYTGRIIALKNIFFIADALKVLKERGQDFKMIFIGEGADKEALKKKLDGDGLSENVYFAGLVYDRSLIADYNARADLFLFPSFYDTDGVVKKEAACQRTPIVCVEGSLVAKTVVKDRNAYIAPNDPAAYADEIMKALADTGKYETVAENAYREVYVTWAQTAQKTLERYKNLIENPRRKFGIAGADKKVWKRKQTKPQPR